MVYIVVLVEYGKVIHKWHYDFLYDAFEQLQRLMYAYVEVNEVRPLLLKVGASEVDLDTKSILESYVQS